MKRIFISYSRKNLNFAERLAHDLHDAGLDVWLDVRQIKGGEKWREAIFKGINQAEIIITCLSPTAIESEWVRKEILMARSQQKTIIPVMIEDCFDGMKKYDETEDLLDLQIISFERGYEQAFPLLLQSLPGIAITIPSIYTDLDPATIPNPFKGLEAFQETDAAYFFGREDLTEKSLEHLRQNSRFLAVVGASGSGKSSLVRAGLIPAIRQGKLTRSKEWPTVIFTPGIRPTESLAKRLLPLIGENRLLPEIMQILNNGTATLHQITESILATATNEIRLVLVVDQFEEVFTRASQAEADQFLNLLHHAVTIPEGRTLVILTMRADFFDRLSAYPELAVLFEQENLVIATDMTSDNLRRSIEGPAEAVGLIYEHGLADRIIDDVRQQPGSLPLLEYALKELYDRRDGRQLTFNAYKQIGGVRNALTQHANDIYQSLNVSQRDIMRRLLLRLVEISETGETTRRKFCRTDLALRGVSDEALCEVIDILTAPESRLLIASRDIIATASEPETWLEVSHEALIREWQQFKDWVAKDEESLRYGSDILKAAQDWEKSEYNAAYLLIGSRLVQANNWLLTADVTDLQRNFVETSLAEDMQHKRIEQERQAYELTLSERARRRAYLLAIISIMLLSILTFMTFIARGEWDRAENKVSEAQTQVAVAIQARATSEAALQETWRSQAFYLAGLSEQQLQRGNKRGAILLAEEALAHYSDNIYVPENRQAMLDALSSAGLENFRLSHDDFVQGARWNAEETRILTWSDDGIARVWDAATGESLITIEHGVGISGALWNTRETQILLWGGNTAEVSNSETGETVLTLPHEESINGAIWNAEETQVLTWDLSGIVQIWNAHSGDLMFTMQHEAPVVSAQWNRSETQILTTSWDGTARISDALDGKTLYIFSHAGRVWGASWNYDESLVLTWGEDSNVRIWNAITGSLLLDIHHTSLLYDALWSPDGTRILTSTGLGDHHIRIWNASNGELLFTLRHQETIAGETWNSDGTQILSWSYDGTARVWDTASGELLFIFNHGNWLYGASWNNDETHILTWSRDGIAKIWDISTGELIITVAHDKAIRGGLWNSTSSQILTWSEDGTARIWDISNREALITLDNYGFILNEMWNGDKTKILASFEDETVRIFDAESGNIEFAFPFTGTVLGLQWCANDQKVMIQGFNVIQIWDATTGNRLQSFQPEYDISGATCGANNDRVLAWSSIGVLEAWDISTGQQLFTSQGEYSRFQNPAWNPDGSKILLLGTTNGTAEVRDTTTGDRLISIHHDGWIIGASWSNDERRILTWSGDNTVRIWDAINGEELVRLQLSNNPIGAAWDVSQLRILTWSADGNVQIWDARNGEAIFLLQHRKKINGATWNADGTQILTWSEDGTARVWDATRGIGNEDAIQALQLELFQHGGSVVGATWNADETQILTWSEDGTARVWDTISGDEILRLNHTESVDSAAWNANETRIITHPFVHSIHIWIIDLDELITIADDMDLYPFQSQEREQFFLPAT